MNSSAARDRQTPHAPRLVLVPCRHDVDHSVLDICVVATEFDAIQIRKSVALN